MEKSQQVLCEGYPRPSLGPALLITTVVFAVLVIVFVALRCWSRYSISREFWWDDWFLIGSAVLQLSLQGAIIWGVEMGFGLHVWNVNSDLNVALYKVRSPVCSGIKLTIQFQWVYEIFYVAVQSTTRMSVLLLYYRIFPQVWHRRILYVLIVILWIHFAVFMGLVLFQCNPVGLVFNKEFRGKCMDFHVTTFAGAICSIVEDLVIITLPIPSIMALRLKPAKKFGVVLIMSVGLM